MSRASRVTVLILALCSFIALVCASSYGAYLWATYIDEVTTSGQAFGLVIGDSRRQTYEKLPGAFKVVSPKDPRIFMEVTSDSSIAHALAVGPGKHVMVQTYLDPVGFELLSSNNEWQFFVVGSYYDSLTLQFCDEKLCRIYRHRKRFELP